MKTKPMRLRIDVTKEIIQQSMFCGTPMGDSVITENCAIALAVRDIFPKAQVYPNSIAPLGKEYYNFTIELPFEARLFIYNFDIKRHRPLLRLNLDPISFEIEIPEELIDHINLSDLERCKTVELVK